MKIAPVLFIIALLFSGTLYTKENSIDKNAMRRQTQQTDDTWQTALPSHVDIDSEKLEILVKKIKDETYQNIHSILLIKEGKLVFERYFAGHTFNYEANEFKGDFINFTPKTIHNLASVTKSITSILFGIAKNQGYINSVDENLFKFFPQYASLNDSLKSQITLLHLLTMTSGLEWNEQDISYGEIKNDIIQLFLVPDPIRYILSKSIVHKPGSRYYYNGGNTNLLGEVIQETSGLRLDVFAKKYLFDPLGIEQYQWIFINPDMVYASGNLRLRPRDMAKIGYLMLNDGIWDSNRIVSSEWVKDTTKRYVRFNDKEGYGYQWWTKKYELGNSSIPSFAAMGWGGQNIIVLPDLDAVIVLTAGNYASKSPNDEIVYRYILPSLEKNFDYDFEKIKKESPISETFEIVKPSDTLNNSIAKISGHWYGRGDFSIADQLVVEKIDSTEASILYSWGDHPAGYFENGWVRRTADVDRDGKITFSLDTATLSFEMDRYEDILVGYYRRGEAVSKLIMNRL